MAVEAKRRPWVARADVERALWQVGGWALTAALPPSLDRAAVAAAYAVRRGTSGAELDAVARRIAAAMPDRFDASQARELAEEWARRGTELSWGRLRGLHRSDWRVRIDLEGGDRLERALARGRGAVVWFSSFCDSAILMRGLAENGVRLSHLSAENHGSPGRSRFGLRFVAPIHRKGERRYLAERIVMRNAASPGYVKQVRAAFAANRAVSFRGDLAWNQTQEAAFLGRRCLFASGAPRMAYATQTPLLTAAAVRAVRGRYRVLIDEEMKLPAGRREFVREAVAEYARRLEGRLAESPADWDGWRWVDRLALPDEEGRPKARAASA